MKEILIVVAGCLLLAGNISASKSGDAVSSRLELDISYDEVVARTNKPGCSWVARRTPLSDLPASEKAKMLGLRIPDRLKYHPVRIAPDETGRTDDLPERFDWRELNGVTPVKDQGSCGSCWDFGATGAWESKLLIFEGVEYDLSEQQVMSCNRWGEGCNGGWMSTAYEVFENPGSILETDMPYMARDHIECKQDLYDKVAVLDGYTGLPWDVSSLKQSIMEGGPISVTMAVYGDFFSYGGGCYEHEGTEPINHSVVLVGWDDSMCDGEGAWIVKNSWGKGWGENGFFNIKYNSCYIGEFGDELEYTPRNTGNIIKLAVSVDDTLTGNGNGRIDVGETVRVKGKFMNIGLDTESIQALIETSRSGIYFDTAVSELGDLAHLDSTDNYSNPFVFTVADTFTPQHVDFEVNFTSLDGYAGKVQFSFIIGRPDLLVVSDNAGDVVTSYLDKDIRAVFKKPFESREVNGDQKIEGSDLGFYKAVVWFTGEAADALSNDTTAIKEYLDGGGALFLSGQNISDELHGTAFHGDYLKSVMVEENSNDYILLGEDDNSISSGIYCITSGGEGANNCYSPSSVTPVNGATSVFNYAEEGNSASVQYDGDFRLVYFSSSFESINMNSTRQKTMERILEFLLPSADVDDDSDEKLLPDVKNLSLDAAPNPFNPVTSISYSLNSPESVSLDIFDISGKLVKRLFSGYRSEGSYSVTWNGKNGSGLSVASGVYVCRLSVENGRNVSRKIVLLK